jgi:outer membrane protein OmpA-like peptidoglycan-associated protein
VFTLTVYTPITVTFVANNGQGSMAPETNTAPTVLTPNVFTRSKHIFARWNTAANGSGASYANGAMFPFTTPTTLYAQWTATTKIAPIRKVTFDANGGSGSMSPESKNVLASLPSNQFTRVKFTFNDWNTAANGSGKSYADDGAYRFTKSTTLFAQWTANKTAATRVVTFKANGGRGSMTPETNKGTAALTANKFSRHGYAFAGWNTVGSGTGSSYVNHAIYRFNKSVILFAQWNVVIVPVIPATDAVVTLNPFAVKSAALSSALEAQIIALATEIKTNHDTKIALVGFSSDLTTSNELNETAWGDALRLSRQRALAVESYLQLQLALLGVTGYTVTASGSGKVIFNADNATAATRAKNNKVVATLT